MPRKDAVQYNDHKCSMSILWFGVTIPCNSVFSQFSLYIGKSLVSDALTNPNFSFFNALFFSDEEDNAMKSHCFQFFKVFAYF